MLPQNRPQVPPVDGSEQNRSFVPVATDADTYREAEAGPLVPLPAAGSFIPETNANVTLAANPIFQAMMGLDLKTGTGRTYAGPSARIARCNVTTIDRTGVPNPLLANRIVDGINQVARDVVLRTNQTDPTQNGFYWLRIAAGASSTYEKLALLDEVIADQGVFALVASGTHANEIWLIKGTGAAQVCIKQQDIVSEIDFTEARVTDYLVSTDDISPTTGNWSKLFKRCVEAAAYGGMAFALTMHNMRATEDVPVWTNVEFRANHFLSGGGNPHISWVGCQGFKVPYPGEAPFSAQVRPVLVLTGVNNFCAGSTGDGIIAHYPLIIKGALWSDCPGQGIRIDSTVDPAANVNSCSLSSAVVTGSGLSSISISGGDANVIPLTNCKGINYATLNVVGDNYGLFNRSFLGITAGFGCEWDAGSRIGIKDDGTHSLYIKIYTEGGTGSDISGPSLIIGGNLTLAPGALSTRLPTLLGGTNGPELSGLDISGGNLIFTDCVEAWLTTGDSGYYKKYNFSGGNQGYYTEGYSTTNTNQNAWASSQFTTAGFSGIDIGIAMRGFFMGPFISDRCRNQHVPYALWPAVAVPRFTGSLINKYDGPRPTASMLWDDANQPQLLGQVKTNSGTPTYTITVQIVAHPSQTKGADLVAGNQNIQISEGSWRRWPAGTATGLDAVTLLTTGAQDGHQIEVTVEAQGFNVTVGGISILAGAIRSLKFQFESGAWLWRS